MSAAVSTSSSLFERSLVGERLHDRALVGVKLGLDPCPQMTDRRVARGGAADHFHDRAGTRP